jgi:hypothetical protein
MGKLAFSALTFLACGVAFGHAGYSESIKEVSVKIWETPTDFRLYLLRADLSRRLHAFDRALEDVDNAEAYGPVELDVTLARAMVLDDAGDACQ